MAAATCSVCCEVFNKTVRKPVVCGFCHYEACSKCTKEYFLGSTQDPHCMSCRKLWNREFMDATFSKCFMNTEYKKHRETVLIDRERSLLPATMAYAEGLKEARKFDSEISSLKEAAKNYNRMVRELSYFSFDIDEIEQVMNADIKLSEAKIRIRGMSIMKKILINGQVAQREKAEAPKERRAFMRACPADGCRGFLSSQWKCGLCDVWACPECHEIIGKDKKTAEHMCKQENIESARLIAKDSRPCPNCASLIFKIEGCDQMFCVQCHTAFSWRTGNIERGAIHNPHYYDIIRKNRGAVPRAIGDQECGGVPQTNELTSHLRRIFLDKSDNPTTKLISAIRFHFHVEHAELPHLNVQPPNNRDLRAQFLLNEIDENKFKHILQKREKKYEKTKELGFTMSMFSTALADMLRSVMHAKTKSEVNEIVKEIEELRVYTNNCLVAISERYNCTVRKIHETNWTME